MESPVTGSPQADTGLPPGVRVGPLGARFVAYVLDSLVPAVVAVALQLVLPGLTGAARVMITLVAGVLILGWAGFIWQSTATRAASLGMRAMDLQLVGFFDGRPIGWGRVLLRNLIFLVLALTGIGLVVMLVLLVLHPRKQGWHDQATQSVIIKARALAPRQKVAPVNQARSDEGPNPPASIPVTSTSVPVASTSGPAAAEAGPTPPAAAAPALAPPQLPGAAQTSPPTPVPTPQERWVMKLDDGREMAVDGLVLLGRNPQPQPGEEDAQLIKLADETRTVSKSHLAVGLDGSGAYVVDRGSTNGSTVTAPNGTITRCQAGDLVSVEPGSIVSMGDHWLEMSRGPVAD